MKRGIHAGRPESSPRLQRVLAVLRSFPSATTRDLIHLANVCAVNTCVAELRAAGYEIGCELAETRPDGARIYRYRLISEPGKAEAA